LLQNPRVDVTNLLSLHLILSSCPCSSFPNPSPPLLSPKSLAIVMGSLHAGELCQGAAAVRALARPRRGAAFPRAPSRGRSHMCPRRGAVSPTRPCARAALCPPRAVVLGAAPPCPGRHRFCRWSHQSGPALLGALTLVYAVSRLKQTSRR
jgi:hypothetical protein